MNFYSKEEAAIELCSRSMSGQLSDRLVVVDLGAGVTKRTICMLQCLLNDHPQVYASFFT